MKIPFTHSRENWYRDIWLFVISAMLGVILWVSAVQNLESRRESATLACEGQNDRHDRALATLDDLIAMLPPERRERAEANKRFTVVLIEVMVPYEDCSDRAERLIPRQWYEF